jgi:hypothetical protein
MIATTSGYATALERSVLYPKWKLLSFNPVTDSWGAIIDGSYVQTPVNLTNYVQRIEYSFDRLQITLSEDAALLFHPDAGTYRTAIKQGRIIRLFEGFEGLAESEWLWTFSGTVEGTYSWAQQRGQNIQVQFSVFSRSNNQAWKRRNVTSNNYTVGSDWSSMFENIAKDVMLLSDAEFNVNMPWGVPFSKNSNQVVNYPPWDALEQLAFGVKKKPWFNGKGQLSLYSTDQKRITESLADDTYVRKYEARASTSETINKVILTYLSNTLSRVDGPDQNLANATVTAGFFTPSITVDAFYSDERHTRCDNPRFIVKQSANAGLLPFCTETMTKIDEFHSQIEIEVTVWAPVLATTMMAALMAAAFIPDYVTTGGFIVSAGVTIPVGRLVESALMIGIMLIMMCIGTGTYEIWGTPYEMVYLEEQAIAIKSGVEFWEEREKEIRNDFVSTLEQAQPLVINELHFEVMKEQPRSLLLRYDPRIEPGDIIQLSSQVKIWVESVSRVVTQDSSEVATMTVTGYRTVV